MFAMKMWKRWKLKHFEVPHFFLSLSHSFIFRNVCIILPTSLSAASRAQTTHNSTPFTADAMTLLLFLFSSYVHIAPICVSFFLTTWRERRKNHHTSSVKLVRPNKIGMKSIWGPAAVWSAGTKEGGKNVSCVRLRVPDESSQYFASTGKYQTEISESLSVSIQ